MAAGGKRGGDDMVAGLGHDDVEQQLGLRGLEQFLDRGRRRSRREGRIPRRGRGRGRYRCRRRRQARGRRWSPPLRTRHGSWLRNRSRRRAAFRSPPGPTSFAAPQTFPTRCRDVVNVYEITKAPCSCQEPRSVRPMAPMVDSAPSGVGSTAAATSGSSGGQATQGDRAREHPRARKASGTSRSAPSRGR